MTRRTIIAGRGPSLARFEWPGNIDVLVVSGGVLYAPRVTNFVTLDGAENFPEWVQTGWFDKHVPIDSPGWNGRRVVRYKVEYSVDVPGWRAGQTMSRGEAKRNHSMIFAVQVAAQLGYQVCIFAGCDLNEPSHLGVVEMMRTWMGDANAAGIEWFCASPTSALADFMPDWRFN